MLQNGEIAGATITSSRYIINILRVPDRGWRYQVLTDSILTKRRGPLPVASGTVETREQAYDAVVRILRQRGSEGQ